MASARDSADLGAHSRPVSPGFSASRQPTLSAAITGIAMAAASSRIRGVAFAVIRREDDAIGFGQFGPHVRRGPAIVDQALRRATSAGRIRRRRRVHWARSGQGGGSGRRRGAARTIRAAAAYSPTPFAHSSRAARRKVTCARLRAPGAARNGRDRRPIRAAVPPDRPDQAPLRRTGRGRRGSGRRPSPSAPAPGGRARRPAG